MYIYIIHVISSLSSLSLSFFPPPLLPPSLSPSLPLSLSPPLPLLSLQTLCVLVQSIYRKHFSSDSSIEVVDILIGVDAADCQMRVCSIYSNIEIPTIVIFCYHSIFRTSLSAYANFYQRNTLVCIIQ